MDIKENLAQNLITFRKTKGLTQVELAEKLNYSDKAVSKWERGESIPDLYVLKQLADFYGVKIDTLIDKPKEEKPKFHLISDKKKAIMCTAIAGLVWLIALCSFAFIDIIIPELYNTWLFLIYAIPATTIVLLIFTLVWGKTLVNMILLTILNWSTVASVFFTLLVNNSAHSSNLWELFLISVPIQVIIVFWFLYRKVK